MKWKYFLLTGIIIIIVFLFVQSKKSENKLFSLIPATVNTQNPTMAKTFTILLVPGHDTNTGGANFNNTYERNLVVDLANNISAILSQNPKYKIIIARDKQSWNPILADYFINDKQAILDFKNKHQIEAKLLETLNNKKIAPHIGTHTNVDEKTSLELYGINKWANENNIDLVIHLHFNSSVVKNNIGLYHGFNIFIPEKQQPNAGTSRKIAQNIYDELKKKFPPQSDMSIYNSLYEDNSLIALGASGTLNKPAILIEYAYIYEKMLQNTTTQKQTLEQMAEQTVLGIQDYLNSK